MIWEMGGKAVIFLHIPKTAGTTLNRIIEWQYNPLAIFTMDPYRIRATPERLQPACRFAGKASISTIAGFLRGGPAALQVLPILAWSRRVGARFAVASSVKT